MGYLMKKLKASFPTDQLKLVTDGKLFNPKYETIKVTIVSPEDSRIDIAEFSVIVATNGEKVKIAVLMKSVHEQFVALVQRELEQHKAEIGDQLASVQLNFDQFFLKFFAWLEKYNTTDGSGFSQIRYFVRAEPPKPKPEERPKQQKVVKPQIKQENVEEQSQSQPQLPQKTIQSKVQVEIKSNSGYKLSENVQQSVAPTSQNLQLVTEKTAQNIVVEVRVQAVKPVTLVDPSEVKTLGQWEAENLNPTYQPKRVEVHYKEVKTKKQFSAENSQSYQLLIKSLGNYKLTGELLQLARFYYESFELQAVTAKNVVFGFRFSVRGIRNELLSKCQDLQVLYDYVKSESHNVQIIFNVNFENPAHSFIRLDPQAEFVNAVQKWGRQARVPVTQADVTDRTLMTIVSKLITNAFQKFMGDGKVTDHQIQVQEEVAVKTESGAQIIRPPTQKYQPKQFVNALTAQLEDEVLNELISQLPDPLNQIPLIKQRQRLFEFLNLLPDILEVVFVKAAENVITERVQLYLIQEYGKQAVQDQSSSESEETDEEYYEDEEEISETSESSDHDDVYQSYATVQSEFLLATDIEQPNGLRMCFSGFDLNGALLLQFQNVSISVVCTKCQKMCCIDVEADTVYTGGQYRFTNQLTGKQNCLNCQTTLSMSLFSQVFNNFTNGASGVEALFVLGHKNCLPYALGYVEQCHVLIQCSSCLNLSLQNNLQQFANRLATGYRCRCPMCFGKISIQFSDTFFALQNGQLLPMPQQKMKLAVPTGLGNHKGPLPNNGICQHAKRSFRHFKFACGGVYPCDTCHEKACDCGDKWAKLQLCGFCGKASSVQDVCPSCKRSLINKKTAHWEGGKGTRNAANMSTKEKKKFAGATKVKSNAARKRTAMRKRGNQKKKEGDQF